MDLEILEALAVSDDRSAALAQLLPGSEDHDYFRCLHAQHAGELDQADQILEAWAGRHGGTERYERLRLRQMLCRLGEDPGSVADDVRDRFGVQHWHEAEVAEVDPTRPTRIADGAFSGHELLEQAVNYSSDLGEVTDEGLYELLGKNLEPTRRRSLLGRIGHTPQPELVGLVIDDLGVRGSGGFGSLRAHQEMTLEQLIAAAQHRPDLRTDRSWVDAVIRRMRPPATVDLELDRDAREQYLGELWRFVSALPPAANSLKVHVLWHLLDTIRKRNATPDLGLITAYLQLPRSASYLPRKWLDRVRPDEVAQLGADFRQTTDLPAAGDDESLVRDLLQRRLSDAEQLAQWFDRGWLDAEVAAAQLLAGTGDADRATLVLGPARAAALRERIELAWCLHNPTRFGVDEPIVLEADVKHVSELVVKVFRIDPLAYFQHQRREVNTDLDLDGLAASHELVMKFPEAPIRRVRRRIELPMCARAGTYVVDLIGNGISSRAVIHKGRLRQVARIGAAGHVVTILDESGHPRPDARAWVGDREYTPDARGAFVVPFSTSPATTPTLLACGDVATVARLELVREIYALGVDLLLDRQALASGGKAKVIARARLTVAGAPAAMALLERTTWTTTLTDRHGVATTKEVPVELTDDDATVLELPLGESIASVHVAVRGKVKVISEQRDQELTQASQIEIASIEGTYETEALYLARTAPGWVLSALGKSGEPRAQRSVTVTLTHRWARVHVKVELATDARGRIELGELPGVARIMASLGSQQQIWELADPPAPFAVFHAPAGRDVIVPLPASYTAADLIRRASLIEMRGTAPLRHVHTEIIALEGAVRVRGLPPGDYILRGPGVVQVSIRIANSGTEVAGHVVTAGELVELPRAAPAISELSTTGALRIRLVDAGPRTRIHIVATTFDSSPAVAGVSVVGPSRHPSYRLDRVRGAAYVSGRELGDEYRYILERKAAKRFPSLQLDRPALLLNPWARRTTTTDVAVARAGGVFAPAPASMPRGGYGGGRPAPMEAGGQAGYTGYDFLPAPPIVIANLVPDETGAVTVPLAELGRAACVAIAVDDPAGSQLRRVALPEQPLEPKDLRLRVALDPARHASQRKAIAPCRPGDAIVIEDLATAKVHLVDSVERAQAYLLALHDDGTLREMAFVVRWHALPDSERREHYSKYACHELHLFLYFKDRAFFDAVVRPYLAHKRTKTFVDHWLLHADLSAYLEPAALARLNAAERALLARRLRAEPALARMLADQVAVLPPDPAGDAYLIDVLLGGATLDGDAEIARATGDAFEQADALSESTAENEAVRGAASETLLSAPRAAPARPAGRAMAAAPPSPAKAKKAAFRSRYEPEGAPDFDDESGDLDMDLRRRQAEAPMYRAADRTQEWAENNWWHRTPADSGADMIAPNRFWRDVAHHETGAFLSPSLGLCTGSFAEAMIALAVSDLPFVAGSHTITADGPKLTIVAAGNALIGTSQIVDGELTPGGAPLVVGQSYVRTDDRHRWVDGEQIDKYVDDFAAGIVYTCQVVLANPTSSRQRIAALVQIPRGSLPLVGGRQTHTIDVVLEPYGTHGHEYAFYFPTPGRHTHFPVHVSRGGTIVAAAAGRTLDVTTGGALADPHSWPHLSQRGTLAEVTTYLATANLAEIDLERVAWRMRYRDAYDAIVAVLERRRAFDDTLWGYALMHRDPPRLRTWVRSLATRLLEAGPVLDMPVVGAPLDAEVLGGYEHLEYSPLINARAHRLGPKARILNDGLSAQYQRFLDLVAHRRAPTAEDLLAFAAYLFAQERHEPALAALARVDAPAIADRLQYDYVAAYAACLVGDTHRARELAARWRELPVDRWRRRFEALLAMLDELGGGAPVVVDPRSRDQQQSELAAKQPAFGITVDRDGVLIRAQHVPSLELRYFEMDIELLFSRQPFVQSDVSRFSYIEPGHRELISNPSSEQRVAWPQALRGRNVVVEAVGAGLRTAKIHYANDLATNLAHQVGQVRVQRASDKAALGSTYVKVYAKKHGGDVAFYKDGYTDLRGWFDYASVSTDELDRVERFAILVTSEQAGSAIVEAVPPAR